MNTYESLRSSLCLSESWNDHIMNHMQTLKIHELHASCPNIQSWEKSLDIYHGRQLTERTFNEVPILSNQFFPKIDVKKMGTERLMDWNIVWFEYNYSWANLSNPFSVGLCSSLLYSTPLTVLPHHRRAEEAVWVWEGETAASWTPRPPPPLSQPPTVLLWVSLSLPPLLRVLIRVYVQRNRFDVDRWVSWLQESWWYLVIRGMGFADSCSWTWPWTAESLIIGRGDGWENPSRELLSVPSFWAPCFSSSILLCPFWSRKVSFFNP